MEFDSNKPIFLQIYDSFCEKVLSGELAADQRIPSVREYGSMVGVNPNTVMRTYERMTLDGICYHKRGIGYFIAPDAKSAVLAKQRKEFMENELPKIIKRMQLLGIDPKEVFNELKIK